MTGFRAALGAVAVAAAMSGCATGSAESSGDGTASGGDGGRATQDLRDPPPSSPASSSASSTPAPTPTSPSPGAGEATSSPADQASGPSATDGRPAAATLTIDRIGLTDLPVDPYVGWTDDAPGTAIQDRGRGASPHGPRGGVGPGGIGNYQVTAHRLSSTQAFLDLPELRRGDRVEVESRGRRLVYRIVGTRETSFRSEASLRAQRAPVPGRPGEKPVRAMITLSTCATPEDRAVGNYWSDQFGNPEHRIDKIGTLVSNRPIRA